MKMVSLPAEDDENKVLWDKIARVELCSQGRNKFVTLYTREEGERWLSLSHARHLFHEVEDARECSFPCYHFGDLDVPPSACRECQLAHALSQAGVRVLPDKIAPYKRRGHSLKTLCYALLGGCVLALLLVGIVTGLLRESPALPFAGNEGKKGVAYGRERGFNP